MHVDMYKNCTQNRTWRHARLITALRRNCVKSVWPLTAKCGLLPRERPLQKTDDATHTNGTEHVATLNETVPRPETTYQPFTGTSCFQLQSLLSWQGESYFISAVIGLWVTSQGRFPWSHFRFHGHPWLRGFGGYSRSWFVSDVTNPVSVLPAALRFHGDIMKIYAI